MKELTTTLLFTKNGPIGTVPTTWLQSDTVREINSGTILKLMNSASQSANNSLYFFLLGVRTLFENTNEAIYTKTITARFEDET